MIERLKLLLAKSFFAAFILFLLMAVAGAAENRHGEAHAGYKDWKTQNGGDCCGSADCFKTEMCVLPDGQLGLKGRTVPCLAIPFTNLQPSPDQGAHVCEVNGRALCAALGGGA